MTNTVIPALSLPQFGPEEYQNTKSILIHNFQSTEAKKIGIFGRNSGPFWEPGAFGGFLNIALLLNIVRKKTLQNKMNILFVVSILTTFSTTAYIALFLVVASYFIFFSTKSYFAVSASFVGVILLIIGGTLLYFQVPFLENKIDDQLRRTRGVSIETDRTRFASAALDIRDLQKSPVVGLGRRFETRDYGIGYSAELYHKNNGTTYFLSSYGILGFLVFFYLIWSSFRKMTSYHKAPRNFSYVIIFIILVLGFSEAYFLRPFFYGLTFLHLFYNQN